MALASLRSTQKAYQAAWDALVGAVVQCVRARGGIAALERLGWMKELGAKGLSWTCPDHGRAA